MANQSDAWTEPSEEEAQKMAREVIERQRRITAGKEMEPMGLWVDEPVAENWDETLEVAGALAPGGDDDPDDGPPQLVGV